MSLQAHYVSGDDIEPPRAVHVSLPLPQGWDLDRGLVYLDEKYPYPMWVRIAPRVERREPRWPASTPISHPEG